MYLTRRFYILATAVILLIGGGYYYAPLYHAGLLALRLFGALVLADIALLYFRSGITAERHCPDRFSNGDDNEVDLRVESTYPFGIRLNVTDEIPFVFQRRDIDFRLRLKHNEGKNIKYNLRPTKRGVYGFGKIRVFVSTDIGLVQRRYTCGKEQNIKVYPSYLLLRQYELLAISNRLTDMGIKRIRHVGNNTEFEQIKDYVKGDDYRTINWKVSARNHQLMVNVYQDERSQQIFNVIDKGRVMQQAFRGMTLLDYAINASLVLSYVAMNRDDKVGLVTFCDKFDTYVPASKRHGHIQTIPDSLYAQETTFGETDFSALAANLNLHVGKRSLMIIYTSFSGIDSMKRQLAYLIQLSQRHRVLLVFFADAELKQYISTPATSTEDYFRHVIAEKYAYEQRLIVSSLQQHGIYSLLTTPESLSIDVINKYLEMKTRQIIN